MRYIYVSQNKLRNYTDEGKFAKNHVKKKDNTEKPYFHITIYSTLYTLYHIAIQQTQIEITA